jgi:hypothetical protein
MNPSRNRTHLSLSIIILFAIAMTAASCELRFQIPASTSAPDIPKYEFEATGEDYLISALDEVLSIADWTNLSGSLSHTRLPKSSSTPESSIVAVTSTDTVYSYGEVTADGYGAVITERYAHPKGLLLITVRKTFGKENGHIVTETKRYVSYADLQNDNPQQTNVTELYGCQADTIVTHVLRNGTLETYTFRLPVVTKVVNPQDGSIRITSRYAADGAVVSKIEDGNGNLVQIRRSYGEADGSTITRTEYPDGSWRQVRTRGEATGTVTRETTSGLPTLGSGNIAMPPTFPRPALASRSRYRGAEAISTMRHETTSARQSFASGVTVPIPIGPRPIKLCLMHPRIHDNSQASDTNVVTRAIPSLASGSPLPPGNIPRPVMS